MEISERFSANSNATFEGLDYGPLYTITAEPPGTSQENIMTTWVQIAWTGVFGGMILTATGGNCIVIWIVIAHRRMRTVTNYFLVNLSTADLLLTTFNCIFNFTYMIQRNWPFGSWYCTISNFIANSTVAASVFTLTGISCDRYLAIVHPLQPRMSKMSSLITIVLIWAASMILAAPCLLYSTTVTSSYRGVERTGCILIWPDDKIVGSKFDFAYQMLFLILTYVVPIILMSLCYTIMGRVLWGSRSIGEMTQRQIDSIKSKRKVVKMFILVVLIFGICWLPYHAYFIYIYYDPNVIFSKYTQHVYLGFYWFAMSNAMVNPLIYYWMNARFRQYFKTAICGWKDYLQNGNGGVDTPPIIGRHSHTYSKSGGDGTIKIHINSPLEHRYQNGHSSTLRRTKTMESPARMGRTNSSRWLQASLRRENQKTTINL
ncbi:tachykinin-like peptides receptor 86C [Aethina tumida]|uniref:tachykinin-like peptides receptor 86C n=1 Tax=Aethina tumida TaxID=116153 RepID=UPI0021485278|nr:tachykinin-like peptides receptor 86C [Aethina tumida]